MIMIIGGAYQGKLAYVKNYLENYREEEWAEGQEASLEMIKNLQGIHGLQRFIWNEMEVKRQTEGDMTILDWETWAEALAKNIMERNPELVILTDEIGYGIVPMEKKEREFREVTGRVCTRLAACSSEVHRVICGIGKRIK